MKPFTLRIKPYRVGGRCSYQIIFESKRIPEGHNILQQHIYQKKPFWFFEENEGTPDHRLFFSMKEPIKAIDGRSHKAYKNGIGHQYFFSLPTTAVMRYFQIGKSKEQVHTRIKFKPCEGGIYECTPTSEELYDNGPDSEKVKTYSDSSVFDPYDSE